MEPDGFPEILQRALHVTFVSAHAPPVDIGPGQVGPEPDGFLEILQRTLHVTFVAPRIAPVVVGRDIVGLKPDSLGVKAQLFINFSSSKPPLKPLLGRQLVFPNCRGRSSRHLLFSRGALHGARGWMQYGV